QAHHRALRALPADPVGVLRRPARAHGQPARRDEDVAAARALALALRRRQPVSASARSRWARLLTESRNPRSRSLDALPTEKVVALLLDEDRRALVAAARERRAITRAAEEVARALGTDRAGVFLGAGTSGRLAVLEAAECPPTFGTDPSRI